MSTDGEHRESEALVARHGEVDVEDIGRFIRERRKQLGLSLAEVATRSQFSVSYISQVERGLANPTLASIKRIGQAIGFTVGELLETGHEGANRGADGNQLVTVLRAGHRKRVVYPGSGIANELLSPDLRKQMEIVWVEAPPGASSGGHPHEHEGEECGIVLSGAMEFWAGEERYVLHEQDSIYLSSEIPHRWESVGDVPLTAVWIISPPTF